MSQKTYKCTFCDKTLKHLPSLIRHRKAVHAQTPRHICCHCTESFSTKFSLSRHIRRVHTCSKIPLKTCCFCSRRDTKLSLIRHYETEHGVAIRRRRLGFKSKEEFDSWKSAMETTSKFIKTHENESKNGTKLYFRCSKNYEKAKSGFCPATITLEISSLVADFIPTHIGHDQCHNFQKKNFTLTQNLNEFRLRFDNEDVTIRSHSMESCGCDDVCDICQICSHSFLCSCSSPQICPHVHFLCSVVKKTGNESIEHRKCHLRSRILSVLDNAKDEEFNEVEKEFDLALSKIEMSSN